MDKCINSLLPAGEDAEIVLVNDGSTKDNTKEIADGYAEKYPNIIRVVHKENGGHGDAVNSALKIATGKYFKVVDSDDWVDGNALKKLMDEITAFEGKEETPDAIIVNYVYEHVYSNTQKFVRYTKQFPEAKLFTFDESKKFKTGQFLAMHSLVYKTEVLKECNLVLPKHTFYVDNLFVYTPLPYIKKFYYLNIDFYRYFIGRADQSVNEKVIMGRIDQHIRVTELLLEAHDLNQIKLKSKKLYKYMLAFISIMMTINSIYLIKIGTKESYQKKKDLWQKLKEKDLITYKKCKHKFVGIVSYNNKFVCAICKGIYTIARKIFKFN
jgi:glycosyltransferase involved in cell wall biosynthesis